MEVNNKRVDDVLTINVEGRLDSTTAPVLEDSMRTIMDGAKEIIFDFTKLEYISSAGLRILLATQKIMNKTDGKLKVVGINDEVKEIFEATGFNEILTVE